jgi:hypothetical protein
MKIDVDVPDGTSGNWKVETFEVKENELSQSISMWKYGRGVPGGIYKRLMRNGTCVMSNTPDEINDARYFINHAKGSILINGLGLGVVVKALLLNPEVTDITVIEISQDVIDLVAPTYLSDSRLTIIHADAFDYKPPKNKMYDAVWHDIWDNICGDNVDEMKKLHRKYGRKTKHQESWCRWKCEEANKRDKNYLGRFGY